MKWTECIAEVTSYIEENITQELTIEAIAKQALVSPFYFQKGFSPAKVQCPAPCKR